MLLPSRLRACAKKGTDPWKPRGSVPFFAQTLTCPRKGLSLLEVLVSLAIFVGSFVVIGRLMTMASDQAVEVQQRSQAAQICQTKMAEVIAGAIPLESQSGMPVEEDPDWSWSLDCQQGTFDGLWNVTVKVARPGTGESEVSSSLTQMVLDPSLRGSSFDSQASTASESGTSGTNQGSTSSSGTSGSSTPSGQTTPGTGSSGMGSSGKTSTSSPPSTGSGGKTGTTTGSGSGGGNSQGGKTGGR